MHPRAAFLTATAVAVTLLATALADPSAAATQGSYRTHARTAHRRHRVAVIRSDDATAAYVTAAYVPARRAVRPPMRTVPRVARVVRPAEAGVRIPEERFAVLFGEERPFHLPLAPNRVTAPRLQFESDGYRFTLLDAIPRSWPDDWYDTDAIAIVERGDGYALLDASHPADPLALRVTVAERGAY